jgi:hypothetical protein
MGREMHINLIGNLGMERDCIKIGGHVMRWPAWGTFTVGKIPHVTLAYMIEALCDKLEDRGDVNGFFQHS